MKKTKRIEAALKRFDCAEEENTERKIYLFLAAESEENPKRVFQNGDVAGAMKIHRATAYYHLSRMVGKKLLKRVGRFGYVVNL